MNNALKCPDCGIMISDPSQSCPNCGCPSEILQEEYLRQSQDLKPNQQKSLDSKLLCCLSIIVTAILAIASIIVGISFIDNYFIEYLEDYWNAMIAVILFVLSAMLIVSILIFKWMSNLDSKLSAIHKLMNNNKKIE